MSHEAPMEYFSRDQVFLLMAGAGKGFRLLQLVSWKSRNAVFCHKPVCILECMLLRHAWFALSIHGNPKHLSKLIARTQVEVGPNAIVQSLGLVQERFPGNYGRSQYFLHGTSRTSLWVFMPLIKANATAEILERASQPGPFLELPRRNNSTFLNPSANLSRLPYGAPFWLTCPLLYNFCLSGKSTTLSCIQGAFVRAFQAGAPSALRRHPLGSKEKGLHGDGCLLTGRA